MKTSFGNFLANLFGARQAWWLEVKTSRPVCTYYFGPFVSKAEACALKDGYIEDLEQEGAQNIRCVLKYCSDPVELTIIEDGEETRGRAVAPALTAQP
ncbi:MAG: DUF1816 domain-containing protein [Cyanobacteria bacterium REEB459]|nr:DUF1816 domain-containing protein [Cyanobacteria bacterium REEB459]